MSAFFSAVQAVADFFSGLFSRLWSFVADYPFVLAAAAMPFFFWLLAALIRLVRDSSDMTIGMTIGKSPKGGRGWKVPTISKGRTITIDGKVYQMGGKRGLGKAQPENHKEQTGKEDK